MVVINKKVFYRSIFYVILMCVYGILGYIFLDSGFNTKTMVRVDYEDNSKRHQRKNGKRSF